MFGSEGSTDQPRESVMEMRASLVALVMAYWGSLAKGTEPAFVCMSSNGKDIFHQAKHV